MTARQPLATIGEVSAFLGIPVATLYGWRSKGTGPRGASVGRHVRYRWVDVERWLDEQASSAPAK